MQATESELGLIMKTSEAVSVPSIDELLRGSDVREVVVDCGCYGWRLAPLCEHYGHTLVGVDRVEPPGRPSGVSFARGSGSNIELQDDLSSMTVASHILEHVIEPVSFFGEMMRITRPGGLLYVEAPSELSALPRASDHPEDHRFVSFWDDPTHVRPWTPGALYRLALSCNCYPVGVSRANSGGIPCVRLLGTKPLDCRGAPPVAYVSLRGVPPGVKAAWNHVWQRK